MIGTNKPPRALTASAKRVKLQRFDRVGEAWQDNLWNIYRDLGAVHYGMTFKRSASMRVNYFVAEQDADTDEPQITTEGRALEAFDRLGDVATIVGDLVVQLNVAGEGWVVGDEGEDEDDFEVLSSVEMRERLGDANPEESLGDMTIRVWLPAPWKRKDADSPLRSVQAQCEQLLLLNDEIGATSMSRIPAGFLAVANELSFAQPPDEAVEPEGDPFMAEIIEIVTTAINDPDSAARVAPNVIRGPVEYLKDGFFYVDISRKMDETFAGMREELLRQIAGGINLPAEILTGLADLNHWSLWGIDESTAKHHVDPDVLTILHSLTESYLWPALEEDGMGRDEARRFKLWRDYSDLTARPMTIEQAIQLYVEGVVSDKYVRQVANVPEDDELMGDGKPQPTDVTDPRANTEPPENIAAAAGIKLSALAEIDTRLSERIIEASEAALHRTLERAGVKVRNKARKNRDITAAIQNVANEDVTRRLGAPRIESLQLTVDELVPANEFDALSSRVKRLIAKAQDDRNDWLAGFLGTELPRTATEDEDRISAVDAFIAAILAAVSARLFTGSPDPDPAEEGEFSDEIATSQMVAQLLAQAGGAPVAEFTPETPRGLALGQRTRAILRDHGYRTESLTWEWAYLRTPQRPYEPHLSLDGAVVEDREDPRLGGYYPGDHKYCTCGFVPTVLPAS